MTDKPDYINHRKRIRTRFTTSGGKGLSDYELLELLLTYAISRKDVKPVAKELIRNFGTISGVLDAPRNELEKIEGLGPVSSTLILLLKELMCLYFEEAMHEKDLACSPQTVVDFAKARFSGLKVEVFVCIYVNTRNEIIDYQVVQEGSVDNVVLYPRKVIENAIMKKAAGIILVHNHPSGHIEPSGEDKNLTKEVIKAARLFDIRVLDHIVIAKSGYFSFKEHALI